MKIKLKRYNKDIYLRKTCPICNSTRFMYLIEPKVKKGAMIIKECLKCGYEYGVALK